jgi:hypothetical protein
MENSYFEETERALRQLLQGVELVPGTFPPVYTWGDLVIGYDRSGQIKVIASSTPEEPAQGEDSWLKRWQAKLTTLVNLGLGQPSPRVNSTPEPV